MSNQLFEKASPLFAAPVPALPTLMQAQVDMLTNLVAKFSGLDLTKATTTALAIIIGGQQPNTAIAAASVLVKAQAKEQGVEIEDQDANVIAQAVTNGVLASIQLSITAQVAASPAANQGGVEAGATAPAASAEAGTN